MAGYTEEEYEQSQNTTPVDPPKGSADWAGQNSGDNAPELKPTPNPAPGTLEAYEAQQTVTPPTGGASTTPTPPQPAEAPAASTDTEHQTPALSPEQQQRVDATAGTDRQIKTIQDWMDAEEHRPETDEQRKKRERKEKSKKIIAAVSDGISALSNLFFTSQYAPNMYNHDKGSMMKPVTDRIEKLKAEREKNADKYLQFSLKLGDLQNERAKTLRELEAQQERQKLAREKAQREADLHPLIMAIKGEQQKKTEQEAISAKYEADNKPTSLELDNEYKRAGVRQRDAAAGASRASAANSYASARAHDRSNLKEFTAWDEQGNPHSFKTEAAANAFAKQHGTYKETEETETTDTSRTSGSRTTTSTSTKKKKTGHAAKPDPTDMDDPTA